MTLSDYKHWLEGFLSAAKLPLTDQQELMIVNKLDQVNCICKQRIRAYEYLVKPLITTNCYENIQ